MNHKAFTLIEAVIVIAIIGITAALLFPIFASSHHYDSDRKSSCISNLKQIGLGFLQYAQDYDEKFPPIANASAGYWAGSLRPYIKSWQLFQCPTDETAKPKTTDYYYNARLASLSEKSLSAPVATLLAGEGTGDSSTSYHLAQLPPIWRTDQSSPAHRHLDAANYLFADGHVKPLRAEKITLDKPALKHPTFLIG